MVFYTRWTVLVMASLFSLIFLRPSHASPVNGGHGLRTFVDVDPENAYSRHEYIKPVSNTPVRPKEWWEADRGATLEKGSQTDFEPVRWVFRGSSRGPDVHRALGGFLPNSRGEQQDEAFGFLTHLDDVVDMSRGTSKMTMWVSTSAIFGAAARFARHDGWVYRIHVAPNMVDVAQTLGKRYNMANEAEFAALGGIHWSQVHSWVQIPADNEIPDEDTGVDLQNGDLEELIRTRPEVYGENLDYDGKWDSCFSGGDQPQLAGYEIGNGIWETPEWGPYRPTPETRLRREAHEFLDRNAEVLEWKGKFPLVISAAERERQRERENQRSGDWDEGLKAEALVREGEDSESTSEQEESIVHVGMEEMKKNPEYTSEQEESMVHVGIKEEMKKNSLYTSEQEENMVHIGMKEEMKQNPEYTSEQEQHMVHIGMKEEQDGEQIKKEIKLKSLSPSQQERKIIQLGAQQEQDGGLSKHEDTQHRASFTDLQELQFHGLRGKKETNEEMERRFSYTAHPEEGHDTRHTPSMEQRIAQVAAQTKQMAHVAAQGLQGAEQVETQAKRIGQVAAHATQQIAHLVAQGIHGEAQENQDYQDTATEGQDTAQEKQPTAQDAARTKQRTAQQAARDKKTPQDKAQDKAQDKQNAGMDASPIFQAVGGVAGTAIALAASGALTAKAAHPPPGFYPSSGAASRFCSTGCIPSVAASEIQDMVRRVADEAVIEAVKGAPVPPVGFEAEDVISGLKRAGGALLGKRGLGEEGMREVVERALERLVEEMGLAR
ncbi:putative enterotoxin [Ophiocordyceps australis]|uniref:Putative enterotoxin n=1 Tax=Ophiocordyceps australis TaxID=1399860 RepID=A0A2C5Y1S0_9HYPO|nr:putative enterotoxin [Ophiocordyceps australis]